MKKLPKKYMMTSSNGHVDLMQKITILSKNQLFSGVEISIVEKFAQKMYPKTIQAMEVFVEEDVDEKQAFFLYEGAISIFRTTKDGDIVNLDLLGAPELVGEMGLVDKKASPTSAMAIKTSKALVLTQADFEVLIHENPQIAFPFLKLFADRIRHFDIFIEQLLSKDLYERTWYVIQYIARFFPNNEILLSHEQLDDLIWGTRPRISEVIQRLEKEGKIQVARKKIKVL